LHEESYAHLGGDSFMAMLQATDLGNFDDPGQSSPMTKNGLRYEFSLHNFCRPDSSSRRRCCSAIGGDEWGSAVFLSTSSRNGQPKDR
jgi:hypothetical protein